MRGHRTAAAGDALALAWRRPGEPGCEYGVKGCGGQGREMRRAKVMPGRQKKRGPANPLVVERLAGPGVYSWSLTSSAASATSLSRPTSCSSRRAM